MAAVAAMLTMLVVAVVGTAARVEMEDLNTITRHFHQHRVLMGSGALSCTKTKVIKLFLAAAVVQVTQTIIVAPLEVLEEESLS